MLREELLLKQRVMISKLPNQEEDQERKAFVQGWKG
jgi:hypothetical protein